MFIKNTVKQIKNRGLKPLWILTADLKYSIMALYLQFRLDFRLKLGGALSKLNFGLIELCFHLVEALAKLRKDKKNSRKLYCTCILVLEFTVLCMLY